MLSESPETQDQRTSGFIFWKIFRIKEPGFQIFQTASKNPAIFLEITVKQPAFLYKVI
jgi:hypothetical protein